MKNKEEKIRERDDRLVKNEKSWRRARLGAICLSVIHILLLIFVFEEPEMFQEEGEEGLASIAICVVFWLLIVDWLNLRLRHIDSIKLYRSE
jgi:hypothetical protein